MSRSVACVIHVPHKANLMHMISTSAVLPTASLDHGINVADLAAPHRLAERGW